MVTPTLKKAVLAAVSLLEHFLRLEGSSTDRILRFHFLPVILFGAALSYGGWMWSEILYDKQVITSSAVILLRSEASNVQTRLFLDAPPSQSNGAEDVH